MSGVTTQETIARTNKLQADTAKKLAEAKLVPWRFAASAFTSGAVLVAAIVALSSARGCGDAVMTASQCLPPTAGGAYFKQTARKLHAERQRA